MYNELAIYAMKNEFRVFITGLGVVSSLGNSSTFGDNLLNGNSNVSSINLFNSGSFPVKIAAQCNVFNDTIKDRKQVLAENAILDLFTSPLNRGQFKPGLFIDHFHIGIGLELFSLFDLDLMRKSNYLLPDSAIANPHFLQTSVDHIVQDLVKQFHLDYFPAIHISACSASTDALGSLFHLLRAGIGMNGIAGGSDSMINPLGVAGFSQISALSTSSDDCNKISRPFDQNRSGFVLGEGAAFFVLENEMGISQSGHQPYCEVLGFANCLDAYGISEPHPEGDGAYRSMQKAILDAKIKPNKIRFINSHGTSTIKNDIAEAKAIINTLSNDLSNIYVNSSKSMIGHCISSSGAVEIAGQLLCLKKGKFHPTINTENQEFGWELPINKEPVTVNWGDIFLKNSFAFGGHNASIIFRAM